MKSLFSIACVASLLLMTSLTIGFQNDGPQGDPLKITASAVAGRVQYRVSSEAPWQLLTEGTELKPGTEIRTGLRSACRLDIEPGQKLSLDRLSFFKIIVANRVADVVKTDIGMNYGRARYRVKSQGEEHDARVISPSATLAIRGTDSMFSSDAFKDTFRSIGAATISNKITKLSSTIGATQAQRADGQTLNGTKYAKKKTNEADPRGDFGGQTDADKERFDKHPGDAGTLLGDQFAADQEEATNDNNNKEDSESVFP